METARSAARDYAGFPGRQPKPFHDNVVSEQAAKRPTIETGLNLQSEIVDAKQYQRPLSPSRAGERPFYAPVERKKPESFSQSAHGICAKMIDTI